jgi:hypothetical protein
MGDIPLPNSERVARELAGLSPEERREAWTRAIKNSKNGRPTAQEVYKEVYLTLEVSSAWGKCQRAEKAGLELGKVCSQWRDKFVSQGGREGGKVFEKLCKKLKIPRREACYWMQRWEAGAA